MKGIDCVKKCVERVDDIVKEAEKTDIFGYDQLDTAHQIADEEEKSSSLESIIPDVEVQENKETPTVLI